MKQSVKAVTCSVLSMMMATTPVFAADHEDEGKTKDETIYAMLKSDGTLDETIVSSWIHNDSGIKGVKETLDIKDVENVKSKEKPVVKGNEYTWNVKGNDVYYEGTSDKELPIHVQISYRLDGKEISGDDLIGKSGKLEIHIKLISTKTVVKEIDGVKTNIHPLYGAAGMIDLSTDNFTNVKCDGAKVLSEGNNNIVGFASLVGLHDTLVSANLGDALKDLPIQDEFVIQADVKDFEMGPVMIAMTPNLPLDNIKNIDSLDDLTKGIAQLNDASAQLFDGTTQLSSASNLFNSKMNELDGSVGSLSSYLNQAQGGSSKLNQAVNGSLPSLNSGITQLAQGSGKIKTGASALNDGSKELSDGMTSFASTLFTSGKKLSDGANDLSNGLTNVKNGLNTIVSPQMQNKLANMKTTLDSLSTSVEGLNNLSQTYVKDVNTYLDSLVNAGTITDADVAMLKGEGSALSTNMANFNAQVQGMKDNIQELSNAITALTSLRDGVNALSKGADDLAKGAAVLNSKDTQTQVARLVDGAAALHDNLSVLSEGSDELDDGVKQLLDKSGALNELGKGVADLDEAITKISSGSKQLKSGSSQLTSAAGQLAGKTGELNQGMKAFKETGIDKMSSKVTPFTDKLSLIMSIKDAMIEESQNQNTFSGAPEGYESEVKYIFKTDELQKPKKADSEKTSDKKDNKKEEESFWDRTSDFFKDLF